MANPLHDGNLYFSSTIFFCFIFTTQYAVYKIYEDWYFTTELRDISNFNKLDGGLNSGGYKYGKKLLKILR
jgi:hypothetical protein